jgi:hypothetical protein
MTKLKNDDPGFDLFTHPHREQRVLTCPQGIVVYQIAEKDDPIALLKHQLHPTENLEAIEQKIRNILAANPDTEFTPELQEALDIKVISFQKAPQKPSATEWDVGF